MKYRRLGKTGLKVSEIGLGSWLIDERTSEGNNAETIVDRAYELGINFFDSANSYSKGTAEVVLGKALNKYPRHSYVLATKVFLPMGGGPNDKGLSRKHIMEQCDASLKRLGVEYIDLYQCHRYDLETPLEETLRALDDLVSQGKILYAGVSEWSAVQLNDAVRLSKKLNLHQIASNQPYYNMFHRDIEKEIIPLSEQKGIGQVVYSPLAQGVLTGKYKPGTAFPKGSRASNHKANMYMGYVLKEKQLQKVAKLKVIAERNEISVSQLALAWILRLQNISSCIIGASRTDQVNENVKGSGIELCTEDLQEIERILDY
ncbi:aldo/keto reductase family protein [Chengkuizengella sediminis]|uniref:aldo/keto reductase family protein n=1 Tax=Chengkuizengella sediminis TaxID=1885917 RepID=UPI00138A2A43|nr:aldo/keto reductase family protein [Chengkuizengella sediminis]NDI35975.1 aldo/keto reductase [Chengkuizengella sediminis]